MLKVKAGDLDKMGLLFERYHRALFAFLYHYNWAGCTKRRFGSNGFLSNVEVSAYIY